MIKITSRDNSLLQRTRAIRDGKIREAIFVEGLRLCEEALRSQLSIEAVICSDELAEKDKAAQLLKELAEVCDRVALVSEELLASISFTKTPQGIVLLASCPRGDVESFATKQADSPLLVVMHGINNPVNVGAILRTAEAAGATGVITTAHTSDPFSPKALRGAMGSAFRLPIWAGATYSEVLTWCHARRIKTVGTAVTASTSYASVDWQIPSALIVGTESTGLTNEEVTSADLAITIPMHGKVESLNVGVAAAIVLYEALRQRARVQ